MLTLDSPVGRKKQNDGEAILDDFIVSRPTSVIKKLNIFGLVQCYPDEGNTL